MIKNVAAALITVTMFTAPVFAQTAAPVSPTPATQPITAKSAVAHVKIKKNTMRKAAVVRHRTHIPHLRHACAVCAHCPRFVQNGAYEVSHQLNAIESRRASPAARQTR
jgi:hypothetical protein